MSYSTIHRAAHDTELTDRLQAASAKEAWDNQALHDTQFGQAVRENPTIVIYTLAWPLAVDTEAAYESAVVAGNPHPGGDPAVITDAAILSSVQANWPPDPAP